MIGSYLFMKSLNRMTLLKDKQTRSCQSSLGAVFVKIFLKIQKLNSKVREVSGVSVSLL